MKKRILAVLLASTLCISGLAGCGKGNGDNSGDSVANAITEKHMDLGEDFDEAYYPDESQIEQKQGKIDVVILFEGSQDGWKALADEYARLHGGQVAVMLNTDYSSGTYQDALRYEITSNNTEWDIVMGNYVSDIVNTYCLNMYSYINEPNAYAGNNTWSSVLEEDAYITDKTGANTSTYIMNSENLWTAWFVNKVALTEAGKLGYKNANGEVDNPVTWADLMNLCK